MGAEACCLAKDWLWPFLQCQPMLCKDVWASYGKTGSSNHITMPLICDRVHLVKQIQLSHGKQALLIWANGRFWVNTSRVSKIRQRRDLTQLLACWSGRTGLGCRSCALAPLLAAAAAGLTHQGMRQDTADRKQEADSETAWKESPVIHLFSPEPFFLLHNLSVRALKAPYSS